jgi:hypothetical protein
MSNDAISECWNKIKALVESTELDVQKNAHGNVSAGVRARRGLRLLKKESASLTKLMVDIEKQRKTADKES